MAYSPEELYAMACMARDEANHNPDLSEVQRNDYAVFASQNMGLESNSQSVVEDQDMCQ